MATVSTRLFLSAFLFLSLFMVGSAFAAHSHFATVSPSQAGQNSVNTFTYNVTNNGTSQLKKIIISRPAGAGWSSPSSVSCPAGWTGSSNSSSAICTANGGNQINPNQSMLMSFRSTAPNPLTCVIQNWYVRSENGVGNWYQTFSAIYICPIVSINVISPADNIIKNSPGPLNFTFRANDSDPGNPHIHCALYVDGVNVSGSSTMFINGVSTGAGNIKTQVPQNGLIQFQYSPSVAAHTWYIYCANYIEVGSDPKVNASSALRHILVSAPQTGRLTVIKHVVNNNGGTATANQFTMLVTGVNNSSFAGSEAGVNVTLSPGAYSVDESVFSGYTKTIGAGCSGTISAGQNLTCMITNDDKPGTLTVIKHVVGFGSASDFTMYVVNNAVELPSFAGSESGTDVSMNAGQYGVSETGPSGYDATYSEECTGPISLGEHRTCTVTNTAQMATLIVKKHVVGFGSAGEFTMLVQGSNPSQTSFTGSEDGTAISIGAGSYEASEEFFPGYTITSNEGCAGTILPGQELTCTIVNTAQPATLTVIKHVINVNGGTAVASDFTMNVEGSDVSSSSFPGEEAPGTTITLGAGQYGVSESGGPQGYSQSSSSDCIGSILPGEEKTCTITNSDQLPGTIIVHKDVRNPAGADVSDSHTFKLVLDGSSESVELAEGTDAVFTGVTPGDHTLTEVSDEDYVTSAPVPVSVSEDSTTEVTITNRQKAGAITIYKYTIGGDGTFDFTGTGDIGDFTRETEGGSSNGIVFVINPGTYQVSELPTEGWQLTSLECSVNGVDINGATATIDLGSNQEIICYFTNTKNGEIIINKETSGGDGTFGFTGPSGEATFSIATEGGSGSQSFSLAPGSYIVTENQQDGWSFSGLECGEGAETDGTQAFFNLGAGQTITCTYANAKNGEIIINKHTVGWDGSFDFTGPSGEGSFEINTTNRTGSQSFSLVPGQYFVTEQEQDGWSFSGLECGEGVGTDGSEAIFNLEAGQTLICDYTNTPTTARLTIVKNTVGSDATFDFSGPSGEGSFQIATSGGTGQQQFYGLEPGQYAVSETGLPANWAFTSLSCSNGEGSAIDGRSATIDLNAGDVVTCTYANTFTAPTPPPGPSPPSGGGGGGNNNGGGEVFIPPPQNNNGGAEVEETPLPEIIGLANNTTETPRPPPQLAPIRRAPLWEIPGGNENSPVTAPAAAALLDSVPAWLWAICPIALVIGALALLLLMRRKCKKCGAMNWPWAKVCAKCGAKLL